VIGNAGFAIAFESDASNLGLTASRTTGDNNGAPDVYLYTDRRKVTLLESVASKAVPLPGGGRNPSMNFYNNYVLFDSPAPLGADSGPTQVYMRYLGGATVGTNAKEGSLTAPQQGETAAVIPSGTVLLKLPAGTSAQRASALGLRGAARKFVRMTRPRDIPIGSTLDTKHGSVSLFTSSGLGRPLNEANLRFGQFTTAQSRKNPLTTVSMTGGGLAGCATHLPRGGSRKASTTSAGRRRRRLFSHVHGRFRSRGRNSSATARGTAWTMTDTCAGTLTRVTEHHVLVRDFGLRKSRVVHAGQKYFARARR
jgi:hypothetical protein